MARWTRRRRRDDRFDDFEFERDPHVPGEHPWWREWVTAVPRRDVVFGVLAVAAVLSIVLGLVALIAHGFLNLLEGF